MWPFDNNTVRKKAMLKCSVRFGATIGIGRCGVWKVVPRCTDELARELLGAGILDKYPIRRAEKRCAGDNDDRRVVEADASEIDRTSKRSQMGTNVEALI